MQTIPPAVAPPSSKPQHTAKRRRRFWTAVVLAPALAIGGYLGFWRYHLKRFQSVAPGVFYRVAQPTEIGLEVLTRLYGVKTVVSLQLFDFRLHRGLLDPGKADGRKESEVAAALGTTYLQWPMGVEQTWPWLTPWQFEEFYRLVDDPRNHPIVVHCMGGRHRTGTLAALYRLEYDRWTPEQALEEMYSFDFGSPITHHEHNIKSYVPRPLPNSEQWKTLVEAFAPALGEPPPSDYLQLVRRLREQAGDDAVRKRVEQYVAQSRPFALPLAARLIDHPDDSLAALAAQAAEKVLAVESSGDVDLLSAAGLIADFGSPAEQRHLLQLLERESRTAAPTPFYESLVRGVTNRYTRNRLPFLRPLLEDTRHHLEPRLAAFRYCDTAVYRVAAITNELPLLNWSFEVEKKDGPNLARKWFAEHAETTQLSQLIPPQRTEVVQVGDGPQQEDLSKMRR